MKCPYCVEEGQKSTVRSNGYSTTTLIGWSPWWDEDGEQHAHNPNWQTSQYNCSRGHRWEERTRGPCPSNHSQGCYPLEMRRRQLDNSNGSEWIQWDSTGEWIITEAAHLRYQEKENDA